MSGGSQCSLGESSTGDQDEGRGWRIPVPLGESTTDEQDEGRGEIIP